LAQAPAAGESAPKLTDEELTRATERLKKAVRDNHVKARDHTVQSRFTRL